MESFKAPSRKEQREAITFGNEAIKNAVTGVMTKADLLVAIKSIGYEDPFADLLQTPKNERPTEGVNNISDSDWQNLCALWDLLPNDGRW